MNTKLGRMQRVELRQIWKDEAGDFTPWLAQEENIALLGEALGLELEVKAQEANIGQFRADILCNELESSKTVIIENQIESTDHKHLGQLLTYAAGVGASFVVWVAQKFTEDHQKAISWLNEMLEGVDGAPGFFGVEIEVWQIGDSDPAPKFNIVAKPNPWSGEVKHTVRETGLTSSEQLRLKYWTALAEFLRKSGAKIECADPSTRNWIRTKPPPIKGFYRGFDVSVREKFIDAYIKTKLEDNVASLRQIQKRYKSAFEKDVGDKVEWDENEENNSCWVCVYRSDDPSDTSAWPKQHAWLIDASERLAKVLQKYLAFVSDNREESKD